VTQNGRQRELTVEEALQHRTYQDAIAGSRFAQRQVLKRIAKREQWLAARRARRPRVGSLDRLSGSAMPNNSNASSALSGSLGSLSSRTWTPPYDAVLGQMVTIKEDGVERRVTAAEAFLQSVGWKGTGSRRARPWRRSRRVARWA